MADFVIPPPFPKSVPTALRVDPVGRDRPVMDRKVSGAWASVGKGRFATGGITPAFAYRNTDRDRKPPRSVVTAQLMGDPSPNRKR